MTNHLQKLCPDSTPSFLSLFDPSIAPPLLYYSYIPIFFFVLFFAFFMWVKDSKSQESKELLSLGISFCLFLINELVQWIGAYVSIVHFGWQLSALLQLAIIYFTFRFSYIFINRILLNFKIKLSVFLLSAPVFVLLATKYNIDYFDLQNCQGHNGFLWEYIYTLQIVATVSIMFICYRKFISEQSDKKEKQKTALYLLGTTIFLSIFITSNIAGDATFLYEINLIGPIGMALFIAFLSYLTVKFDTTENTKIFGTQILVATLISLIFSILFLQDIYHVRLIGIATLILVSIVSMFLIKGVKKEVEAKEEIQQLANHLEKANIKLRELDQQKSEFISLASHQLRGPLTAIKGYGSLILEGDFGPLSKEVKEAVETMYKSTQALIVIVGDYLDVSRIEQGRMKYEFTDFNLHTLIKTLTGELEPSVKIANLSLTFESTPNEDFFVHADQGKIKQVIGNLIDNSIKYTKKGSISISLTRIGDRITTKIQDTGVGIIPEVKPRLFEKFTRAPDASKTNIMGTGLGLYVAKKMIEAHRGRIWADSEGQDKGSTFFIELEAARKTKPEPNPHIPEFEE